MSDVLSRRGGWSSLFRPDPDCADVLLFVPMCWGVVCFVDQEGATRRVVGLYPRIDATRDGLFLVMERLFPRQLPSTYAERIPLERIIDAVTAPRANDFPHRAHSS